MLNFITRISAINHLATNQVRDLSPSLTFRNKKQAPLLAELSRQVV
jgi:hypothetical protein